MLSRFQILAARAMLEMTRAELAAKVGLSSTGLSNIENGIADPKVSTMEAIRKALEGAGVEFVSEDAKGAGVRFKKPKRRR